MSTSEKEIELSLMQNAIDSLERSIDLLAWEEEQDQAKRMKQAILSAAHGIELFLKARLRLIHPSLVWENVEKYPSLSARTVGIDSAISRLINIGGVALSSEDVQNIRTLRDKRNAIEHFAWSISSEEAHHVVGSAIAFAVFFSKTHLNYDFFGYYTKDDDTFVRLMESNSAFAHGYKKRSENEESHDEINKSACEFCKAVGSINELGICNRCGHMSWKQRYNDEDLPF